MSNNIQGQVAQTLGHMLVKSPLWAHRLSGKRKIEAEFDRYKSQARVARSPKSDLDIYLEEKIENDTEGFDVLAWWKSKSENFLVLPAMAIPLSTVSSELLSVVGEEFLETIEAH
ncbi:hypothetical protein C2845_PM08G09650 [Panicum miliaceum]|uniref:HAT C-terminal dimerisation domain-containing protein n=1 Tax=Panicum miliaceum TaxID=4540 RepID=A0A3L6R1V6_PANMI|nr:hypothetical protein C2845_PM08G09650 [Panicum miliaceum]